MSRFGYSASGIDTLKSLYATLHSYAEATDAAGSPVSMVGVAENLNFTNGTGAQLVGNKLSIDGYVSQLQGVVDGIVGARQSIGMSSDDVLDWWGNVGFPQTTTLSVAENAYEMFQPAGGVASDATGSFFDAIPLWVKIGGGGLLAVILMGQLKPILSLFKSSSKRKAVADYRRRR